MASEPDEQTEDPWWTESWSLDFAGDDGLGGYLRLAKLANQGVAWFWSYLVGPDLGLVVVRDHEIPLPPSRTVRAEGLWAELVCETPGEHWSIGLEAFGVRLDSPADAFAGEIGARVAVGLDVEWETSGDGEEGRVYGDILVGRDRIELDAAGSFRVRRGIEDFSDLGDDTRVNIGAADAPPTASVRASGGGHAREPIEVLGVVAIPAERRDHTPLRLVRVLGRSTDDHGVTAVGWTDLVELT